MTSVPTSEPAAVLAVPPVKAHRPKPRSVLILGSVASGHGDERWWFFLGTITASAVWFVGFTYGARYLAPLLRTERAWRILDTAIALIMLAMAVMLVVA